MGRMRRGLIAAALFCAAFESVAQSGASIKSGADALLAIDRSRSTVIDRIVA